MSWFDWFVGLWPFGSVEPSGDFTRDLIAARQRWASNDTDDADPELAVAVGIASTMYGNALAGATVTGASRLVADALTPPILGYLGRMYASKGMATLLIDVGPGGLQLTPCRLVEVRGGRLRTRRRAGHRLIERWVAPAEVVHVVYEPSEDPLVGLPPWIRAPHFAAAAVNSDRALQRENASPVGWGLSTAGDLTGEATDDATAGVIKNLNDARGKVVALPTQSDRQAYQPPATSTPPAHREGVLTRFGPTYSQPTPQVVGHLCSALLAELGVPPVLAEPNAAGGVWREARRYFQTSSVGPVAKAAQAELRAKLDQPRLELEPAGDRSLEDATNARADHARAQAVAALAGAGVPLDDALARVGL
ncbi:MAG: hypothetical protein OXG38_02900 [Chloroflexi bacterium]|nr:hypothetical protein [Chloroflexota bacterium]